MGRTVFLFPTQMEAEPLMEARTDLDIRICGMGIDASRSFVEQMIDSDHTISKIVLCGIAGSYTSRFGVGDIVCVTTENFVGCIPPFDSASYTTSSTICGLPKAISNTVIRCAEEPFGAHIENMEGGVVFALCQKANIEVIELRAISNEVGQPRQQWDIPLALYNLTRLLKLLF